MANRVLTNTSSPATWGGGAVRTMFVPIKNNTFAPIVIKGFSVNLPGIRDLIVGYKVDPNVAPGVNVFNTGFTIVQAPVYVSSKAIPIGVSVYRYTLPETITVPALSGIILAFSGAVADGSMYGYSTQASFQRTTDQYLDRYSLAHTSTDINEGTSTGSTRSFLGEIEYSSEVALGSLDRTSGAVDTSARTVLIPLKNKTAESLFITAFTVNQGGFTVPSINFSWRIDPNNLPNQVRSNSGFPAPISISSSSSAGNLHRYVLSAAIEIPANSTVDLAVSNPVNNTLFALSNAQVVFEDPKLAVYPTTTDPGPINGSVAIYGNTLVGSVEYQYQLPAGPKVRSVSTAGGGSNSILIPAGAQVGDLLLLFLGNYQSQPAVNATGWTQLELTSGTGTYTDWGRAYYKVATSADIAVSLLLSNLSTYGGAILAAVYDIDPVAPVIDSSALGDVGFAIWYGDMSGGVTKASKVIAFATQMTDNGVVPTFTPSTNFAELATQPSSGYHRVSLYEYTRVANDPFFADNAAVSNLVGGAVGIGVALPHAIVLKTAVDSLGISITDTPGVGMDKAAPDALGVSIIEASSVVTIIDLQASDILDVDILEQPSDAAVSGPPAFLDIYADAFVSGGVLGPNNAIGAPDGVWTTTTGNNSWTSEWALGDPPADKTLFGNQSIDVLVRKEVGQSGTPSASVRVLEGGIQVASLGSTSVTSTAGAVLTVTFDAAVIANPANLSVEIVATAAGGNPSTRTTVQVDAITWHAQYTQFESGNKIRSDTLTFTLVETADVQVVQLEKLASDNLAVDSTEVSQVLETQAIILASDIITVGISDDGPVIDSSFMTIFATDITGVGLSENVSAGAYLDASDGLSLMMQEGGPLLDATLSSVDITSVSLAELSDPQISLASVDSLGTGVTDASQAPVIAVFQTASDSISVGITDAQVPGSGEVIIIGSDVISVGTTDAYGQIAATVQTTDIASIGTTEGTTNRLFVFAASDELILQTNEPGSGPAILLSSSDTLRLYIDDVGTPLRRYLSGPAPDDAIDAILGPVSNIIRRVEIYESDGITPWAPQAVPDFLDGMVTVDQTRPERRTVDLNLYSPNGALKPHPGGFWYDKIIKVFRGVESPQVYWETQIGEFMIDRIDDANFPSTVKVTGRDYAKKMISSKLPQATSFPANEPVEEVIRTLALNCGVTKFQLPLTGVSTAEEVTFDQNTDRWKIASDLAVSNGFELFFTADGYLTLQEFQDPILSPVLWTFQTGPTVGNLVNYNKSTNDSLLANHVVVTGETLQKTPIWAEAINTDPASPTSVENLNSQRTYFYESAFVNSFEQCQEVADRFLKIKALEQFDISMTSIVIAWLDVGNIVQFLDPDPAAGDPSKFLLSSFSIPLSLAPMQGTMKRVRLVTT